MRRTKGTKGHGGGATAEDGRRAGGYSPAMAALEALVGHKSRRRANKRTPVRVGNKRTPVSRATRMNRRGGASSGGSTPTANPRPAAKGGAAIQAGSLRDERERRLAVEEELHESEAVRLRQRAEVQPMIEELAIAVDELERGGQLQLALEQESQQSFEFLADSIQDIKKTAAARLDELAVGWAADVENIHTQLKRLAQAALEEQQRSAMRLRVQRKDVEIARGEMQAIREGLEERVASQAVLIEHQRVSMDEQLEAAARERCELRSQIATLEEGVYTLDGEQMKLRVQMASVAARASRGVVLGGSGGDSGDQMA